MRGFLLRHLCPTRLTVIEESLQTCHLHGVDAHLSPSHIGYLHVIEDLDVGLSHLHLHIILGFLQILNGSFQIELVELDWECGNL